MRGGLRGLDTAGRGAHLRVHVGGAAAPQQPLAQLAAVLVDALVLPVPAAHGGEIQVSQTGTQGGVRHKWRWRRACPPHAHVSDLCGPASVARAGQVDVVADVLGQLRHVRLAEALDLRLGLVVRVEVAAAERAADVLPSGGGGGGR